MLSHISPIKTRSLDPPFRSCLVPGGGGAVLTSLCVWQGVKRANKSTAIDLLVSGEIADATAQERTAWEGNFEEVPALFTPQVWPPSHPNLLALLLMRFDCGGVACPNRGLSGIRI